MTRLLALSVLILATAAATASGAVTIPRCTGAELTGTFKAIPGSEGAGNIIYKLTVKNVSTKICSLSGLPAGTLLNKAGKAQTTSVIAEYKNRLATFVTLEPGKSTIADARFSPDVPGVGEGAAGKACEPTSYFFRLKGQGGGATTLKIAPPTAVCEHGRLQFSAYGQAIG